MNSHRSCRTLLCFMIGFDKCGAVKSKHATVIFREFNTNICFYYYSYQRNIKFICVINAVALSKTVPRLLAL